MKAEPTVHLAPGITTRGQNLLVPPSTHETTEQACHLGAKRKYAEVGGHLQKVSNAGGQQIGGSTFLVLRRRRSQHGVK